MGGCHSPGWGSIQFGGTVGIMSVARVDAGESRQRQEKIRSGPVPAAEHYLYSCRMQPTASPALSMEPYCRVKAALTRLTRSSRNVICLQQAGHSNRALRTAGRAGEAA